MASLHNFRHKIRKEQTSWVDSIGQKIKSVAEFAGPAKSLYDVGRGLYTAAQTYGPIVAGAIL